MKRCDLLEARGNGLLRVQVGGETLALHRCFALKKIESHKLEQLAQRIQRRHLAGVAGAAHCEAVLAGDLELNFLEPGPLEKFPNLRHLLLSVENDDLAVPNHAAARFAEIGRASCRE